jgi:hypothetical protein
MPEKNGQVRGDSRLLGLWTTVAALVLFAAVTQRLYRPPPPLPADAAAQVFSAQRAAGVLRELLGGDTPHPLASAADAQVRARILRRFAALGIPAELQSGWACDRDYACGFAVNIVAHVDGSDPGSGAVLLASHYDSVPAGPGAGDDGNGVASILEIARILKQQPAARHPLILLIDEGEEAGLLGARLFVAEYPAARTIRAAVNLEARGDEGPSLMFETGAATDWAMRLYAGAVTRPMSNSLYYFIYKLLPNDTDFTVFKAAGFEGFNFALIGGVERYHTPQDRLENLDLGSLQHQGQNALATVQALAMADLSKASAARAVFFDVFGRALLHWPARWAAWLGVALTALLIFAVVKLAARAAVRASGIIYALAALLCGWFGAIVISAGLLALMRAWGAVPPALAYAWTAHPEGMHAACVAVALLAPACAAWLFAGRTGSWGLWLANALLSAALGLISALEFPELSFLFVAPVLAGLAGAWLVLRTPQRSGRTTLGPAPVPAPVAALPVLGAGFVLIPSLLLTYPALGTDAWPIITAALGLGLLGLAPMLADASPLAFRVYAAAAALTVVAGAGLSLMRPPYSAQRPQRTVIWYALDADSSRAQWLVKTDSHRLHTELPLAAGVASAPSATTASVTVPYVAPAPPLALPAPQLEVLGREAHGTVTSYRLRIVSARAAPELELAVPGALSAAAVTVANGGRAQSTRPWRAPDHTAWFKFIGVPSQGLELRLDLAADADLPISIIDRSYGLPEAAAARQPTRALEATSSQDGDLTLVYRSVRLSALSSR